MIQKGTLRGLAAYGDVGPFAKAVLHILCPRACVACREDLISDAPGPLCAACLAAIAHPPRPACVRCGGALGVRRDFCGACAGRLFACRLIRATASHRGSAAALVHAFKFRGFPSAAREAGRLMGDAFTRAPELAGFDALVPVPLHPRRLRERGYNQAELIAREIGAKTGRPLWNLLERRRAAAPAWRLKRAARHAELSGAFAAAGAGADIRGKRFLIVDDVCASSSTLEECALALRRAGARDAAGYVFSRAGWFMKS